MRQTCETKSDKADELNIRPLRRKTSFINPEENKIKNSLRIITFDENNCG